MVDSDQTSRLARRHFAIAELKLVKDADFYHFAHLLSWNQQSPLPKRQA
jgi:hypothetical protein